MCKPEASVFSLFSSKTVVLLCNLKDPTRPWKHFNSWFMFETNSQRHCTLILRLPPFARQQWLVILCSIQPSVRQRKIPRTYSWLSERSFNNINNLCTVNPTGKHIAIFFAEVCEDRWSVNTILTMLPDAVSTQTSEYNLWFVACM